MTDCSAESERRVRLPKIEELAGALEWLRENVKKKMEMFCYLCCAYATKKAFVMRKHQKERKMKETQRKEMGSALVAEEKPMKWQKVGAG